MQGQGEYYHNIVKETVERFPNHSIVEIGTDGGYIVIDDFDLLGGEEEVKQRLTHSGTWHFNYDDRHHRCYFQKFQS